MQEICLNCKANLIIGICIRECNWCKYLFYSDTPISDLNSNGKLFISTKDEFGFIKDRNILCKGSFAHCLKVLKLKAFI